MQTILLGTSCNSTKTILDGVNLEYVDIFPDETKEEITQKRKQLIQELLKLSKKNKLTNEDYHAIGDIVTRRGKYKLVAIESSPCRPCDLIHKDYYYAADSKPSSDSIS